MAKKHISANPQEILSIPMDPNDCGANTIGDYLYALLCGVLREQECFSGKRPFGNSGWDGHLMKALHKAGRITIVLDEDGCIEELTQEQEVEGVKLLIDAATALLS